jgi:hypothetical protein
MQPGTKYFFKGFVKKKTESAYALSEEKSFTTLERDTLGTFQVQGGQFNGTDWEIYNGTSLIIKFTDLPYTDLLGSNNENFYYYYYLYENLGEVYINGIATGQKIGLDSYRTCSDQQ